MIALFSILIMLGQVTTGPQKPSTPAAPVDRVEIVLFSDFQCPYCAQFALAFRELQSKGVEGVQTTVQFKHFPLGIHPAAPFAHQAAIAAAEQGKFWEMHDLLFANQSAVKREDLMQYAGRLGLDLDRFTKDLDGDHIKQLIEVDKAEAERLGVRGTPTLFVCPESIHHLAKGGGRFKAPNLSLCSNARLCFLSCIQQVWQAGKELRQRCAIEREDPDLLFERKKDSMPEMYVA